MRLIANRIAIPDQNNTQNEHLEFELVVLKKTVFEKKTFLVKNETCTASPRSPDISQPKEKLPPRREQLDVIRTRGIPGLKEKNARLRKEHDYSEAQKILSHLEEKAEIGDIYRLGHYEEKKTRTILLKVPNVWHRRLILSSAMKLKEYSQPDFTSRQFSKEETVLENESPMERRDLIYKGTKNSVSKTASCTNAITINGPS